MVGSEVTVEDLDGNVNGAGRAPGAEMQPEGKGRSVILKADGYRIWKRQRPEEKGIVLKGHVRLWIQRKREPKKQACVRGSKGCLLKGSKCTLLSCLVPVETKG